MPAAFSVFSAEDVLLDDSPEDEYEGELQALPATPTERWRSTPPVTVYKAIDSDGVACTLWFLAETAGHRDRTAFHENALTLARLTEHDPLEGLLRVRDVGRQAYLGDAWTIGDASNLPALGWELDRLLEFVRTLAATFSRLHDRNFFHGGWWPGDVLLDDDFAPVLSTVATAYGDANADLAPGIARSCYVAPEVLAGMRPDARSDVFVFGRFMHLLLTGDHPHPGSENTPYLKELADAGAPEGLIRIIRRCTTSDRGLRYESITALVSDLRRYGDPGTVGIGHPEEESPTSSVFRRNTDPGSPSSRRQPPASTRSAPASSRRAAPSTRRPSSSRNSAASRDDETPELRPKLIAAGLTCVVALTVGGFFVGTTSGLVQPLAYLVPGSLAVAAWGAPVVRRLRIAFAAAALLLGFMVDPVAITAVMGDEHRLTSGDVTQRADYVRQLLQNGRWSFSGVDLAGANLEGAALSDVDMEGCNLSGANLRGVKLVGASLVGANMEGVDLSGADMSNCDVGDVAGLDTAQCDAATTPPYGWSCTGSKLKPPAGGH